MEMSQQNLETPRQVSNKKGGLRTMPFIIANETFAKVADVGLHANMILYLKSEYHLGSAKSASIIFLWSAISNLLPVVGAFLSDSYFGRFKVIAMGTLISLFGMIMLWLTTILPKARPPHCNFSSPNCMSPSPPQLLFLFTSFALMSMGSGGIRPCSLAFGADQLNKPENPNNDRLLQTFFNWYYASLGISITIAVFAVVYIQMEVGWLVGFGVPVGLMLVSMTMFFCGSSFYVKVKANKSMVTGLFQVIVAAWINKELDVPPRNFDGWFFHRGSKLVAPTDSLRFLNKACIIKTPDDINPHDGLAKDPWNLCTVKQVEVLKALLKILPIWSTGIIISTTTIQHSFSTLQATTMNRKITRHLTIPAASFGMFGIFTLTIWVAIYDRVLVPFLSKFTRQPKGLSFKQRMGTGLAISCLASLVSTIVERRRRNEAILEGFYHDQHGVIAMSAMWLVPQHCLVGLAEGFNAIGQIEFYYSQFPNSMASVGVALWALGMAMGSLVGALIVGVVDGLTKRGGHVSWVSNNINTAHFDYYYWILTILGVLNFLYYVVCISCYGCEERKIWDEGERS